jgi:2-polyprenyl-3-methyl-5-hydroxy-6-metoxy-1,4-benzoquinol methylase
MGDTAFEYAGGELANFSIAVNWKTYWSSTILPYLGKHILEVGAGIGSSTRVLSSMSSAESWLCLEPDTGNIDILQNEKSAGNIPAYCEFRQGGLTALEGNECFDSILYIDVLEHIEDDESEILLASDHLNENGYLIILAPTYPFLFSEFDKAIGHYRRYTRGMFADRYSNSLIRRSIRFLDSVGLLTSLGNRFLLRSPLPTKGQLAFWDKYLVPLSRLADWIIRYRFGRSILVIYQMVP